MFNVIAYSCSQGGNKFCKIIMLLADNNKRTNSSKKSNIPELLHMPRT